MGKTKFYSMILLVVAVIVISGCTQITNANASNKAPTSDETTNSITYDNPTYGIRIDYPSDWTKDETMIGVVAAFLSPQEGVSDLFRENINIIVQDLSRYPLTLEEYTELSLAQIEQLITDSEIIDSRATTLDGNPAQIVVYTGKQGQYSLKWMQVWTIKDDKAYVISYTAEVNEYDNFLGTAQEMINSFEII